MREIFVAGLIALYLLSGGSAYCAEKNANPVVNKSSSVVLYLNCGIIWQAFQDSFNKITQPGNPGYDYYKSLAEKDRAAIDKATRLIERFLNSKAFKPNGKLWGLLNENGRYGFSLTGEFIPKDIASSVLIDLTRFIKTLKSIENNENEIKLAYESDYFTQSFSITKQEVCVIPDGEKQLISTSSAGLFAEKLKLIENEQVLFHVSGNFSNWNQKQMLSKSKKEAEQCFAILHKFMTLPRKVISPEKKTKSSGSIFEDDPLMGTEDVLLFDSDDETILGEIKIKPVTDNKEYENGCCPITGEKYVKTGTGNGYYCRTHGKENSKKLRPNDKYLIAALEYYGAVDFTIWNNKLRGFLEIKDAVKLKWWQNFVREYMAARAKQIGQLKKSGAEINSDIMALMDSWKVSASSTKKRIKLQADFKEPKLILAEIANLIAFYADYITPSLQEQRDMAYKKACYAMRRIVLGAIEMYNIDHEEMMHEIDLEKLINKGYLKKIKRGYKCPLGGSYSYDEKSCEVRCSKCSK